MSFAQPLRVYVVKLFGSQLTEVITSTCVHCVAWSWAQLLNASVNTSTEGLQDDTKLM